MKDNYDLPDFQAFLEELGTIRQQHITFYLRWVRLLLSRHNYTPEDVSSKDIESFLEELKINGTEDWQIIQAKNAINLYFSRFLGLEVPDEILSWKNVITACEIKLKREGYSENTIKVYLKWCQRFSKYMTPFHPQRANHDQLEKFLVELAVKRKVAARTQNQALNALSFMYREVLKKELNLRLKKTRAKIPKNLPVRLTGEEIRNLFACLKGQNLLMAQLIYGSGLTLKECISLKVNDIDLTGKTIHIRSGNCRDTILPSTLISKIRKHLEKLASIHLNDRKINLGGVSVPDEELTKDPDAGQKLEWQWFFPSDKITFDEKSEKLCRTHVFSTSLPKAIKIAAKKAGIPSYASPQVLRHSFAIQMLAGNCNIRELQELLGHKDIRNTMVYQKFLIGKQQTFSPLDEL